MFDEAYSSFRIVPSAAGIQGTPSLTHMPEDRGTYTVTHKNNYLAEYLAKGPHKRHDLVNAIHAATTEHKPIQAYYARENLAGMGRKPVIQPHGLPGP